MPQDPYNPGQRDWDNKLHQTNHSLANKERNPVDHGSDNGDKSDLQSQEKNLYNPSDIQSLQPKRFQRFKANRKTATGLGIGGGIVAILVAAFVSFLPMKLEMLIKSVSEQVMQIPQDAIEERTQYLVAHYLTLRVLGMDKTPDTYRGTPFASMFKTWQANKFEDKLGIKIESQNRDTNRQRATNWKITFADGSSINGAGGNLDDIMRQINIDNSKDMRRFVNTTVKDKTKFHQFYKRYALRKTLMRTKGVSKWAWLPESATEKIDDYNKRKSALKKELRKNLYAGPLRATSRASAHLACLMNNNDCEKLKRKGFGTTVEPNYPDETIDCSDTADTEACERHNKTVQDTRNNLESAASTSQEDASKAIEDMADNPEASKEVQKLITKQAVAKVAGGAAILDMIAKAVDSVDKGSINQIVYDRNTIASAGIAAELTSINDQWKDGSLSGDQFNITMEALSDYGANPAWQTLIGTRKPSNESISRDCRDDDNQPKETVLPKGQLVCDDKMLITDKTGFTDAAWWKGIVKVADIWNKTAGSVFDAILGAIDYAVGAVGIDKLVEWIMDKTGLGQFIAGYLEKFMSFIFGMPYTGDDTGQDLGDGMIAGQTTFAMTLGESSLDFDPETGETREQNNGLGIGGAIMDPEQVAVAQRRIAQQKTELDSQQSMMARLFDTENTNSFVSQMAIHLPTSSGEFKNFGTTLMNSFASIFTPKTDAAAAIKNPFFSVNVMYGYANSEDLQVNPSELTPERCLELEEERENSYKKLDKYPIMVYTKTNPCALEKVVGASLEAMLTEEYPDDFKLEGDTSTGEPTTGGNGGGVGEWFWPLGEKVWNQQRAAFLGDHYAGGGFLGSGDSSVDISFGAADEGLPVYAMLGGTVKQQPLGRSSYSCTGSPNSSNNGGLMIESKVGSTTVVIVYAHGYNVKFKTGDTVPAGAQIMNLGNVGNSCGSHLHMDATANGKNFCLQDAFLAMGNGQTPNLANMTSIATSTCGGRG